MKESMERRYGKKQLLSMVNDIQAETWIGQNSKPCPHCNAPIEVKVLNSNCIFLNTYSIFFIHRKRMGATKCLALVAALSFAGCALFN